MSKLIIAFAILALQLPMTMAFASATPATVKNIEVSDLVGEYKLVNAVVGSCAENLQIITNYDGQLRFFAFGGQYPTVQFNFDLDVKKLNVGFHIERIKNGLNGTWAGWSLRNYSLEGNQLRLQTKAYTTFGSLYWQNEITAVLENGVFSYSVKEKNFDRFPVTQKENQCVFSK